MQESTKKTIGRLLLTLFGLLLVVGGAYLLFRALGWTDISREGLQKFIESMGVIAPIIFMIISFLQVTFIPIPGAVTVWAGCYVFGWFRSLLYSYVGMMAGSMVAFWLGRAVGRRFVSWLLGSSEKTDEWLMKFKDRENVLLFFMFLFPGFPDDILCSLAGILPITWGGFFAMQAVTRATSIGATVLFLSGDIIPYHGWGLVVLGACAAVGLVAFIICFRRAAEINAWCVAKLKKISRRKAFDFLERMKNRTLSEREDRLAKKRARIEQKNRKQ